MYNTIELRGAELDVEYDYFPEEPETGSGAIIEVHKIEYQGIDWTDIFEYKMDIVIDAIYDKIKEEVEYYKKYGE